MSWADLKLGAWLRTMGVERWHVGVSIALAVAVASLEGVSLGLLVPIAIGVTEHDFGFVQHWAGFRFLIEWYPGSFESFASLFVLVSATAFGAAVLKNVLSYGAFVFARYWYGRYQCRADDFVFSRCLGFGKLYFDRMSQGSLQAILGYTGELVDLLNVAQKAVVTALTLLAYVAVMAWISWRLMVFVLCFFPILHLVSRALSRRIESVSSRVNDETLGYHAQAFNVLSSIPLLQASAEEETARKRYAATNETLRRLHLRNGVLQGLLAPFQEIVTLAALLSMIGFLAFYVADRRPAELAVFLVFFFAARAAVPKFTALQEARVALAAKKPKLAELGRLLDDDAKYVVPDGAVSFSGLERDIRLQDLHFGYPGGAPVLRGVTATIPSRRTTAIVGPTGAGKSTLVHLLMGFYEAPPGSITLDGRDLATLRMSSLRRRVAFVSQDAFLFNESLRANLLVGVEPAPSAARLEATLERARLTDFVAALPEGLETRIGDRGLQLSGGEKQRVAICRALLRDAEIVILDEATSALDSETEREIQEAFDEAIEGRTAIVIAHRLSTVRRADQILVLEDGRIVERGDLGQLLALEDRFADLWRAQGFS